MHTRISSFSSSEYCSPSVQLMDTTQLSLSSYVVLGVSGVVAVATTAMNIIISLLCVRYYKKMKRTGKYFATMLP